MNLFRRASELPDLARLSLTYAPTGATRPGERHWVEATPGFRRSESTTFVGRGPEAWDRAASAVPRWTVKIKSGFSVEPEGPVQVGQRLWVRARLGPVTISEPVAVVAEPDRVGLVYGTLEGHPVSGEEAFVVERDDQDRVWLTLRERAPAR